MESEECELSVKFQSHSNLVNAALYLSFQDKPNEKLFDFLDFDIQLLQRVT